ncbi:hypothetical protein EOL94_00360 [bacterium]|nr:hypothetical protein [bacterium]
MDLLLLLLIFEILLSCINIIKYKQLNINNMNNYLKKIKLISLSIFVIVGLGLGLSACNFDIGNNLEGDENNNINKIENSEFLVDKNGESIEERLEAQKEMKKINSFEDLKKFLDENKNSFESDNYNGYGIYNESFTLRGENLMADQAVAEKGFNSGITESSSPEVSGDYSKTNIQVEGVDEADIVKTDGKNIYTVNKKNIFLTKAYPANEASIESIIKLEDNPREIYVNGDYLVVFGYENSIYERKVANFIPRTSYTFVKIFNIKDISNPVLIKDLKLPGSYSDSRLLNGKLYLITNAYNYNVYRDGYLPEIIDNGEAVSLYGSERSLNPSIYYFPLPYESYNYTNVFNIDLSSQEIVMKLDSFLLNSSQDIYMSKDNLYITYTNYLNQDEIVYDVTRSLVYPYLDILEKNKIQKIDSVEPYILSDREKRAKISSIFSSYLISLDESEQELWQENIEKSLVDKYKELSDKIQETIVHKISLVGINGLEPVAQGEVPGRVLNQFSLDENNGYFRIATTRDDNRPWFLLEDGEERSSSNNVYVLDKELNKVGSVENLAEGERIYSARFIGDRAYLVTFKQVDPLFVIDLSNPRNPKVLGELKIPGFSNYLHPYSEDILIGFGKQTKLNEWDNVVTEGLKLSLFDVSDPENLKELDTYITGDSGSYSAVLNDHKALLFSKEKNLLVLPVSLREYLSEDRRSSNYFNGALVFSIEDNKFNLRGKIDHNTSVLDNDYNNRVNRALYIGDNLYTISNNYLKINNISNLDEVNKVKFVESFVDYQVIKPE